MATNHGKNLMLVPELCLPLNAVWSELYKGFTRL